MKKMLQKLQKRKLRQMQHVCDLSKGSESHLPRLPPNAPFYAKFKRWLQKILLVSANHPSTRLHLRSKASIAFEKRRHGISLYWWIIHPYSRFRFTWDIVMTVTYLYLFFIIPHVMSFKRIPKGSSTIVITTMNMLTPGYGICLIDMIFNSITGYILQDGHEISLNPTLIIKHYVQTFFIIDLLSSIPYTWFYHTYLETPGSNARLYLLFLEILPLLKFCRMRTLRRFIKQLVLAFGASRNYEYSIWIFCLTTLIFHWAACLTYSFPFFYAYAMKTPLDRAEGYIFDIKLYEKSELLIYLTSLYMGGGNLCSYSHKELKFTALPDKVTRCILLLSGMAYFLYVIVIVLQLVSSSTEPELKYQSIIYGVKDYIKHKKLPENLKNRLLHFYEHRFQGSLFKEKAIISTLSKNLNIEITQHSSKTLLESSPLFNNIPSSFLNSIIGALKPAIFFQDDIIYKCGTIGKSMYFIVTGTVAIVTFSGKEVYHIKDGDYFGEIALIQSDHKRITTVIALEICEVLKLNHRDFNRLVQPKSDFYDRIKSVGRKRLQDIIKVENDNLNSIQI